MRLVMPGLQAIQERQFSHIESYQTPSFLPTERGYERQYFPSRQYESIVEILSKFFKVDILMGERTHSFLPNSSKCAYTPPLFSEVIANILALTHCLQIPAYPTAHVPFHHHTNCVIERIDRHVYIEPFFLPEPSLVGPIFVICRGQIT